MPSLSPPMTVVLFDAVGTLIDARPSVAEVYAACARRQGVEISAALLAQRFPAALAEFTRDFDRPCSEAGERARWRQIVAHVFAGEAFSAVQGEAIFTELWEHFAQPASWAVYDDVLPVLNTLAGRGLRLGVASNFDQRLATIFRGLPELAACEELFSVSRVGWAKPAPAYYARVAELLKVPAEQILLVGDDAEHDVHAARRAGWQAVLLARRSQEHQEAVDTIRSLGELPPLLATLALSPRGE